MIALVVARGLSKGERRGADGEKREWQKREVTTNPSPPNPDDTALCGCGSIV